MRVRVLLLRGVVVRVVRVQVRRVRAGRVVAVRPLRRRDGDLVLIHRTDARGAFVAGDTQHLMQRRVAEFALFYYRGRVQRFHDLGEAVHLLLGDEVLLVEQQHVGALDLLHEQIHDRPLQRVIEARHQERRRVVVDGRG